MTLAKDQIEIGRQRIQQVFNYLKALNEHRNPVTKQVRDQKWLLWMDTLPDHPSIMIGQMADHSESNEEETTEKSDDFVLRVRRPQLTRSPDPPEELRSWLLSGWENPDETQIRHQESRNESDEHGETIVTRFENDPRRLELLAEWRTRREEWRKNELPARMSLKVFDKLYDLHGRMEREGERLDFAIGDGILSWQQREGDIFHPVLIQRVQLEFNATIPEFTITYTSDATELYTSLFQSIADVDPQNLANCRRELEQSHVHPLSADASAFLKRFSITLSSHGNLLEHARPPIGSEHPTIGRSPVLLLRTRTLGFSTAIERVLESIANRSSFSAGLMRIVGVEAAPPCDSEASAPSPSRRGIVSDVDIFFGKASNPEQTQIARMLAKHSSVLVQGPPGTGKSHTIGNLIGHLLAQGKSVLVTSQTTKALSVLRDHVVEELRPLCVSVLDSDMNSRQQLEDSVSAISHRLSDDDAERLKRESSQLDELRRETIRRLDALQDEIQRALANEYRDVVFAGQSFSPSEAAKKVAAGVGQHDWIPGPIESGDPLSLSPDEIAELYATNATSTVEDCRLVDEELPNVDDLLTPEEFHEKLTEQDSLHDHASEDFLAYWNNKRFTTEHRKELDDLVEGFRRAVGSIVEMESWRLAAVYAGHSGPNEVAPWDQLVEAIDKAQEASSKAQLDLVQYSPQYAEDVPLEEQLEVARSVQSLLAKRKRLGWLTRWTHSSWMNLIDQWKVRGRRPGTVDEFQAIENALCLGVAREELKRLWDILVSSRGEMSSEQLGERIEHACTQYSDRIRGATSWWSGKWMP
ncbi:AAA domain-containing protein [Planctomycetes bacterium Pan216]|uniref:AAA domain-containing protein n=1 Tax=Kolteria novifilia TaxID=2527975 RepID=UPI0011A70688